MSPAEAMNTRPGNGRLSILIVDDEPAICEFLATYLTAKNFKVSTAPSAEDALVVWQEHQQHFDLLLTDVIMPGATGKLLADQLRREKATLKVIFMSGYLPQEIGDQIFDEIFLKKPFHPNELMEAVRSVMHSR
jgi:two-component system, cell cycle sensor histidine kinase and response regulator CckA